MCIFEKVGHMRLFFAVEFDDFLKDAVSKAIANARIASPPWRWVARSNVHITIKFLGETADETVPPLIDVVSGVCREIAPFDITLGGLGGFPNLKKPRVLFYETTSGARELAELARRIETVLQDELSIPMERRPFRAHATVARVKQPVAPALEARLQRAPPVDAGSQRVQSVSLMKSELRREGAVYEVVKSIALGGTR
jgi:2'-5' RNA ligase